MGPPSSAVAMITTRAALRSSRSVDVSCRIGRFRWGGYAKSRVGVPGGLETRARGAVDVTGRYRTQWTAPRSRLRARASPDPAGDPLNPFCLGYRAALARSPTTFPSEWNVVFG